MSANPAFVDFCTRVCACVRFRPDHPSIQRELMGHLEDRYDAILEQEKGILLADAQARTVMLWNIGLKTMEAMKFWRTGGPPPRSARRTIHSP